MLNVSWYIYCIYILYDIKYIYIRFTPTYHKVQNTIPNGLVEISGTEMLYGLLGIYSHMLDPMSTIAGHYHIYIYLMFIYLLHPKLEVYCVYWCLLCLLMFIVGSLPHWYWWYFLHSNATKKKRGLIRCCSARLGEIIDEFIVFLSDPNLRPAKIVSLNITHMLHGAGIFTNICPKNHPNVGKYTIYGAYG